MGADRFWLLGDLVAMGPDPVGTVQRLRRLEPEFRITGNTDRLVSRAEKPYPSATEQGLEADVVDRATRRAAMLAWTRGALATSGDLEWLADSSPTHRCSLADGTTVLAVHASPTRDRRSGISPGLDDSELSGLFAGQHAQLILGGHTHDVTDRTIGEQRYVNPGSVSNHSTADKRARYALIRDTPNGHHIVLRAVDYDVERTICMIESSGLPGADWLIKRFFRA
jgi:diadenosine tetraphosphatase ApaH/serine/threonine PP2A family protein phosphatase